jgi:hypothetical protein
VAATAAGPIRVLIVDTALRRIDLSQAIALFGLVYGFHSYAQLLHLLLATARSASPTTMHTTKIITVEFDAGSDEKPLITTLRNNENTIS